MSRYDKTFETLKAKNEIAFIPFAVAGDPDIELSECIFRKYIDAGADILEIGYPFSDPIADGPVNQRAANRALDAGLTPGMFFSMIKRLRAYNSDIPFGLLLYANTIYRMGCDAFCKKAAHAGIDSLLVADLPPEESDELQKSMQTYGIGRVYIVSELTPTGRLPYICNQIDSFVYVVSRLGATGVGKEMDSNVGKTIKRLRKVTDKPLAVGFGVSEPGHIRYLRKAGADAAIVGSALVTTIELHHHNQKKCLTAIGNQIAAFKEATGL